MSEVKTVAEFTSILTDVCTTAERYFKHMARGEYEGIEGLMQSHLDAYKGAKAEFIAAHTRAERLAAELDLHKQMLASMRTHNEALMADNDEVWARAERLEAALRELVKAHDTLQNREWSGAAATATYERHRDNLRAAWAAARAIVESAR